MANSKRVMLKDTIDGGIASARRPAGVFVFIGLSPNTGHRAGQWKLDERGLHP